MSQKFVVTFYDEDRKTILEKQEVSKGENVKYQGKMPEKPAVNGIEYTFVGWETTGNIQMVMEHIDLFAKYEESSKVSAKQEDILHDLSEANAENAKLDDVMRAGQKVNEAEKATRNLSVEQKKALVNEVKNKGSVHLEQEQEAERD